MTARYHPLYDGLWSDDAFDARDGLPVAPFEERAFFAFLCSNHRLRPSGIYRATDEQLAVDSGLPVAKVRRYLASLTRRRRIVRDGAWIFVRGYLARQPKQSRLLIGARLDVAECASRAVLEAFCEKYPLFRRWSEDRLVTVSRLSASVVSPEQSRAEQSTAGTTPPIAPPSGGASDDGFAAFWAAWPKARRLNRVDAVTAWRKLAPPADLRAVILDAVARLHAKEPRYIPHPHRWLAKRRWEDQPETSPTSPYADWPELWDCGLPESAPCGGCHATEADRDACRASRNGAHP